MDDAIVLLNEKMVSGCSGPCYVEHINRFPILLYLYRPNLIAALKLISPINSL